jgi:hypothetical protein
MVGRAKAIGILDPTEPDRSLAAGPSAVGVNLSAREAGDGFLRCAQTLHSFRIQKADLPESGVRLRYGCKDRATRKASSRSFPIHLTRSCFALVREANTTGRSRFRSKTNMGLSLSSSAFCFFYGRNLGDLPQSPLLVPDQNSEMHLSSSIRRGADHAEPLVCLPARQLVCYHSPCINQIMIT